MIKRFDMSKDVKKTKLPTHDELLKIVRPYKKKVPQYNSDYHPVLAKCAARSGMTLEEIAKELGISRRLLGDWAEEHSELKKALSEGKAYVDGKVELSLFQKAVGGCKEVTITTDSDGGVKTTEKILAPDTIAIFFWLQNRKRDVWKNVNKIEKTIEVTGGTTNINDINIKNLNDEELLNLRDLKHKMEISRN